MRSDLLNTFEEIILLRIRCRYAATIDMKFITLNEIYFFFLQFFHPFHFLLSGEQALCEKVIRLSQSSLSPADRRMSSLSFKLSNDSFYKPARIEASRCSAFFCSLTQTTGWNLTLHEMQNIQGVVLGSWRDGGIYFAACESRWYHQITSSTQSIMGFLWHSHCDHGCKVLMITANKSVLYFPASRY